MRGALRRGSGRGLYTLLVPVLLSAVVSLVATGCATAQPSGRHGLLESGNRAPAGHASSDRSVASNGLPWAKRSVGTHRRPAVEIAAGSLRWPLQQVSVTSPFGKRGSEFHEGIDLKAPQGTPVLAAQEGTVIYAGSKIRGYGKMVVIRHLRQFSTIYAHNSQILVRVGQYVRQGQKISITGKTGHVTGPHLHFEVRDGLVALNPVDYLPTMQAAAGPPPPPPPPPPVPARRVAKRLVSARGRKLAARSVSN